MSRERQSRTGSSSNRRATTTSVVEAQTLDQQARDHLRAENEKLWAAMGLTVVWR